MNKEANAYEADCAQMVQHLLCTHAWLVALTNFLGEIWHAFGHSRETSTLRQLLRELLCVRCAINNRDKLVKETCILLHEQVKEGERKLVDEQMQSFSLQYDRSHAGSLSTKTSDFGSWYQKCSRSRTLDSILNSYYFLMIAFLRSYFIVCGIL